MKIVLNVILAKEKGMGGFNVAVNFFNKTLEDTENEWYYFVSTVFDEVIKGLERGVDADHYYVFNPQPNIKCYFSDFAKIRVIEEAIKPDVIYSILAPSYFRFKTVEVMRCANAWSVVGGVNKYAWQVTPLKYKIRYVVKAQITHYLMRKTKYFITQSNIAKQCILRTVHTLPENVCVISNVLSDKYQKIDVNKVPHSGVNMVYASSPSVHKDYLLLPQVAYELAQNYNFKDFKIHISIPEYANAEFKRRTKEYNVEAFFINHGFMNHLDLAKLYLQCDLGLFPSLLETFSATLLEYMYFELPIIASDLDFNKEIAGDAALYFKPHDAKDMAASIYRLVSGQIMSQQLLIIAKNKLANYLDNTAKYNDTVDFLNQVVEWDSRNRPR